MSKPLLKRFSNSECSLLLSVSNIHIYNLPNVQGPSPVQAVVQPSQVLSGHTSFVYALDSLSSGEIVSSGEDRSARVWKGEQSCLYKEILKN